MSQRVQAIRGTTAEIETLAPRAGEYGFDTAKKEAHVGDGATLGALRLAKKNLVEILAPAQLMANTNDYSPTGLSHAGALAINADAARDLTGIVPTTTADTTNGRKITIYNTGSNAITLKDQSAFSAAANRFDLNGADLVLASKTSASFRYSAAALRWHLEAQTVGAAVAPVAVIARTLAASSQGFSLINGTLVESHVAGALTIAIKTSANSDPSSSDPVLVIFRDQALATGGYTMLQITAATSLVISSGSSMGATNSTAFRLWIVGFNDAGTFRLGAINCGVGITGQALLAQDALQSSTAEGGAGAADNLATFYTGTAVTSKPIAVLGYFDYPAGLASVGAWGTSPTTIQLYHSGISLPGSIIAAKLGASSQGFSLINGTLVPSVNASALTIAIKTLAGNDPSPADPVLVLIRNVTAGAGDFTVMSLTAATSLVVPSTATLGSASNVGFRLWIVGFNDAGAFRLGVINCLSGKNIFALGGFGIASSTATPASAAWTFYTATGAAVTSKPYSTIGYLSFEDGLAAAGTWSATPTRTQLFGLGVKLPGDVVQATPGFVNGVSTTSTVIPFDDTIPQITEGAEFATLSITPSSKVNLIEIEAELLLYAAAQANISMALFQDATANALIATSSTQNTGYLAPVRLFWAQLAALITSTTFRVRAGPSSSLTITLNGSAGSRLFGGVAGSFMRAVERMT